MKKGTRVYWHEDPHTFGTVLASGDREALVVWDNDDYEAWYDHDILREAPKRKSNPPAVYAPTIQDLEFTTRIHPITKSLVMERDEKYRGVNKSGPTIAKPKDIWKHYKHMSELDQEHIVVGLLDTRQNLVGWKLAHKGEIDSVGANVKDMLKDAILGNARSMFILHNHPSGDPSPSDADVELTEALSEYADDFGVSFYDHVIVGRHEPYFSFREAGYLTNS